MKQYLSQQKIARNMCKTMQIINKNNSLSLHVYFQWNSKLTQVILNKE